MLNHNGYFKEAGKYYILDCNGKPLEISLIRVAQLEMIRKDGFKS